MSKGVKCKQGGTVEALVCSGLQMISNKAANGSYENDSWKNVACAGCLREGLDHCLITPLKDAWIDE